jgi:hypothetical protein
MLNEKLDKSVRALIVQWNIAEQRIKKAEQVRGGEVVASAIFELRYAGRKIIDALDIILEHNIAADTAAHDRVHDYLSDATEDCVKAKHDAIDAIMSFVTGWFKKIEAKVSLTKVQTLFPDYLEATGKIADIQAKITESRKSRTKLRDAIYNAIDQGDYDKILALFERMERSKDRVEAEILGAKIKEGFLWFLTIAGVVLGMVGLIATLRHW